MDSLICSCINRRRRALLVASAATIASSASLASKVALATSTTATNTTAASTDERQWMDAAFAQKALAESWGDQPYGAVLVIDGTIVGDGASRVVQRNNPDAHAEMEAIRHARRRLGRDTLSGSVLYSTSRPCPRCERAAASANVSRMVYSEALIDAGIPRQ